MKIQGRTYQYLTSSEMRNGLKYFTFDKYNEAVSHSKDLNHPQHEPRVKENWLKMFYDEMKAHNAICKECEQIGKFAKRHMEQESSLQAYISEEAPISHYLEVAAITAENVTGFPIVKFQLTGQNTSTSIPSDSFTLSFYAW